MYNEIEKKLLNNTYKEVTGITCFDNNIKGPNVALFAVTHGNEISGFESLEYLYNLILENNLKVKGKLFLIVHNLKAFKEYRKAKEEREVGVTEFRFIDHNMNRIYDEKDLNNPEMQNDYEIKRANEIKKILNEFSYVFDMHSTGSPSEPMLIYDNTDSNKKVAIELGVINHILEIQEQIAGTALISYFNDMSENNVAMVHEAGQHFDKNSLDESKRVMFEFLNIVGSIEIKNPFYKEKKQHNLYLTVGFIHISYKDFKWIKLWSSFDEVKKGELLATENNKDIVADDDYILLIPNAKPKVNTEAVYLAKKI